MKASHKKILLKIINKLNDIVNDIGIHKASVRAVDVVPTLNVAMSKKVWISARGVRYFYDNNEVATDEFHCFVSKLRRLPREPGEYPELSVVDMANIEYRGISMIMFIFVYEYVDVLEECLINYTKKVEQ